MMLGDIGWILGEMGGHWEIWNGYCWILGSIGNIERMLGWILVDIGCILGILGMGDECYWVDIG